MYSLLDIRREMDRLDAMSGMDTKKLPIRISSRLKSAYGMVRYKMTNGKIVIYELVLSELLLKYGTEQHILETVRHEYAHLYAVKEYQDGTHGPKWKMVARRFGCPAEKAGSYYPEIPKMDPAKVVYVCTCLGCGIKFTYASRPKWMKLIMDGVEGTHAICSNCGCVEFKIEKRTTAGNN